jgi:serine/threonine protein kinase
LKLQIKKLNLNLFKMEFDLKVGKNFILQRKLGSGAFAEIFQAIKIKTGETFAAKLEQVNSKHKLLKYEAKLLKYLLHVTLPFLFDNITLKD